MSKLGILLGVSTHNVYWILSNNYGSSPVMEVMTTKHILLFTLLSSQRVKAIGLMTIMYVYILYFVLLHFVVIMLSCCVSRGYQPCWHNSEMGSLEIMCIVYQLPMQVLSNLNQYWVPLISSLLLGPCWLLAENLRACSTPLLSLRLSTRYWVWYYCNCGYCWRALHSNRPYDYCSKDLWVNADCDSYFKLVGCRFWLSWQFIEC